MDASYVSNETIENVMLFTALAWICWLRSQLFLPNEGCLQVLSILLFEEGASVCLSVHLFVAKVPTRGPVDTSTAQTVASSRVKFAHRVEHRWATYCVQERAR